MQQPGHTPAEILANLPEDRRALVQALRDVINANIPEGVEEGMQYGMIAWFVPHSVFPAGYHCDPRQPLPYVSVANQKGGVSLYLFCTYLDPAHTAWFAEAWKATGKRLDMGKGCVRIKRLDDVPLEVVAEALRRMPLETFLPTYEAQVPASARKKAKRG